MHYITLNLSSPYYWLVVNVTGLLIKPGLRILLESIPGRFGLCLAVFLRCLLRSPCLLTSWTCTVIRACPSKVCPSATPALQTCPTSKGNTQVSRTVSHCRRQCKWLHVCLLLFADIYCVKMSHNMYSAMNNMHLCEVLLSRPSCSYKYVFSSMLGCWLDFFVSILCILMIKTQLYFSRSVTISGHHAYAG